MAIPNWVTLSQNQGGTGTTVVSITAQTYSELVQRVGALTVNTDNAGLSATVSLVQEAREVVNVSVSPSYINVPQTGGTYVFNVVSNGDWNITSYPDWCTLSTTSGTGNQAVTITVPANYSLEDLIGSIVVETLDNTASIVVTQNKLVPELSISPTSISADTTGGTYYLTVNSNTYWVITAPNWVVLSEYSGLGDSIITVDVIGNVLGEGRNGEIIITDIAETVTKTCNIQQNGNDNYFKYFSIEPTSSGLQSLTISWDLNPYDYYFYYSLDDGETWIEKDLAWTSKSTTIEIDRKILLKANNTTYPRFHFYSDSANTWNISGNIMSLVNGDNFINETSKKRAVFEHLFTDRTNEYSNYFLNFSDASQIVLPTITWLGSSNADGNYGCYFRMFFNCRGLEIAPVLPATEFPSTSTSISSGYYEGMFQGCTSLTTAPVLPITTLAERCYQDMFRDCTSLTTSPVLPATIMEGSCYNGMFAGCTSLVNAPELPATTLAYSCYNGMFDGCTSLVNAPELPATTMRGASCYSGMFSNCTSLTTAPVLPATTLEYGCYWGMFQGCTSLINAPELPVTTLVEECYRDMFAGCTSLVNAPELPATIMKRACYSGMFSNCTSLTTAPVLPAKESAATSCYSSMFYGCSSLNYIKCLLTYPDTSYTMNWVYGVASTGTFVEGQVKSSWSRNSAGIPNGWTIEVDLS